MMEKNTVLDEILERSIQVSANVSNTMLLVGAREYDRFCVNNIDQPTIISFEQLVHNALNSVATWVYEPVFQQIKLSRSNSDLSTPLPNKPSEIQQKSLLDVLADFKTLSSTEQTYAVIIDAGLLFENISNPVEQEFQLLRLCDEHIRSGGKQCKIVLRTPHLSRIPEALVANSSVRAIYIPSASQDVRFAYANLRSARLASKLNTSTHTLATLIAKATEDWTLAAVDRLIETAVQSKDISVSTDIDEIARLQRLGVINSPWFGKQLRTQIKNCSAILSERVKGQGHAITAVTTVLKKAASGLAGAHEGKNANAPRGALLFCGPTGTGKTELCKGLAELLYGDDQNIIRFDCAEFREPHTLSRLIGAPPGYVGFVPGGGGELTDAIRRKPASILLLDEIEKANPKLWDVFLSIIADGRLTNSSGQVSDFSQCLIIFTSNLGMYSVATDPFGDERRVANFDYDTPYETINLEVRQAIKNEFVMRLGRPEILGRLGGEKSNNIVVFDFLRDIPAVIQKFTVNLYKRIQQLHNVELIISQQLNDAIVQSVVKDSSLLLMGGRGVATLVEQMLTDPLADYLFDQEKLPHKLLASYDGGKTTFTPQ